MTTSRASSANELDERIAHNLAQLREFIVSCGRQLDEVRILAVTKTFSSSVVDAARRCGLTNFGENYSDELALKSAACAADLTWHYLGALQSRKIPLVVAHAQVIESVSRRRELEILARQSSRCALMIQVDYTGREDRNGVASEDLDELVRVARDLDLDLRGLMTVAPSDPQRAREAFGALAASADQHQLVERSMGMSDDLALALAAGSTEIRVGRALFGARSGALDARDLT